MNPATPKRSPLRRRKPGDGLTDECRAGDDDACLPGAEAVARDGFPTSYCCGHHYSGS